MTELPRPGRRIAVRYDDATGARELIGYVAGAEPDGLLVRDRGLALHRLAWSGLVSWRGVPQVPRGRNPLVADPVLLDRMAADPRLDVPGALPTDSDVRAVARLCDLLGPDVPDQQPEAYDCEGFAEARDGSGVARAVVVGEWATILLGTAGATPLAGLVVPLARWAAYRDARSLQVRGLPAAPEGFTALRRT